jgi:hypothetical protein
MAITTTENISREAPDIEAYKLGLLESAKTLADEGMAIPPHLVAQLSKNQITAIDLAKAGIGGYQPHLEQAGISLAAAHKTLGTTMSGALPFQKEAGSLMRNAAAAVPGETLAAQTGIQNAVDYGAGATQTAVTDLGTAANRARSEALVGQGGIGAASGLIPGVVSASQSGNNAALAQAGDAVNAAGQTGVATTLGGGLAESTSAARAGSAAAGQTALNAATQAGQAIGTSTDRARAAATEAGAGGIGAFETTRAGLGDVTQAARNATQAAGNQTTDAIQNARGLTRDAALALQQAGALGTQSAQQGIAGLAGTTGAYDPSSAGAYMNQYEDAAVQQALADIGRAGAIQQQGVDAQAVNSGAFGGSRQAVAQNEVGRQVLEQQGRTAAGMRQQGYESASQRAQQAFESQQGRGQQAAQLTGALGSQGAQAGISAANAAGQLGLSSEQLAASTAQQQGQLGLSAEQLAQQGLISGGQLGLAAYGQQGQLAQGAESLAHRTQ